MQHESETKKHMHKVRSYLKDVQDILTHRGLLHDQSKLSEEEAPYFRSAVPKLAASVYGSDEYKKCLEELKPALLNHYMMNRHHPEHFENGILDMNLIDLVEMLADWKASTLRQDKGDLRRSIEINQERFHYSDYMKDLLLRTAEYMGWIEPIPKKGKLC